MIFQE